jgi:hypothetical protein
MPLIAQAQPNSWNDEMSGVLPGYRRNGRENTD